MNAIEHRAASVGYLGAKMALSVMSWNDAILS